MAPYAKKTEQDKDANILSFTHTRFLHELNRSLILTIMTPGKTHCKINIFTTRQMFCNLYKNSHFVLLLRSLCFTVPRSAFICAIFLGGRGGGWAWVGSNLVWTSSTRSAKAGAEHPNLGSPCQPGKRRSLSTASLTGKRLVVTSHSYQWCGSGMFIPDPDFFPSRIPDPKKHGEVKIYIYICFLTFL